MDYVSNLLKRFSVILVVLLLIAACAESASEGDGQEAASSVTEETSAQNQLTEEERDEDWTLLFNGEDLDHWRGFQQEDVPSAWRVQDGTLFFDPEAEDGGDIVTREQYGSFELAMDWRISEGGNSGIFYLVSEDADATFHTGPEYQLLDDERHPDAENGPVRISGSNYDLHSPSSQDVVNPAGEWNETRIIVQYPRVEHWLNGEQVVEYELDSEQWQEDVANSKFSEMPGYGQNEQGHIALQDHGDEVWFRNIRIRELD